MLSLDRKLLFPASGLVTWCLIINLYHCYRPDFRNYVDIPDHVSFLTVTLRFLFYLFVFILWKVTHLLKVILYPYLCGPTFFFLFNLVPGSKLSVFFFFNIVTSISLWEVKSDVFSYQILVIILVLHATWPCPNDESLLTLSCGSRLSIPWIVYLGTSHKCVNNAHTCLTVSCSGMFPFYSISLYILYSELYSSCFTLMRPQVQAPSTAQSRVWIWDNQTVL